MTFVSLVDTIRYANCYSKKPLAWKYVLRHLEAMNYGVHKSAAKLTSDYWSAVNYFLGQHEGEMPLWDAYALVDMVEDHFKLCTDGWEIDWPRALCAIHPDDHWITERRLKTRYERALEIVEENHRRAAERLTRDQELVMSAKPDFGLTIRS